MTPTRTPHNPVLALRRSTRRLAAVGVAAVACLAAWALWPLEPEPITLASGPDPVHAPAGPAGVAFNADAFKVTLWTPTPVPPPAPVVAQKTPPPPLKLQLIGITRDTPTDGGPPVLRAALYDPESDQMLIVAAGEKITTSKASYTVASLTADTIELADGETVRKLSLNDERRPGT
ncbi:MAG: hypothetical protein HEQ23_09020 [Tepidisphaera sp.]